MTAVKDAAEQLERGRSAFAESAWTSAHESLSRADGETALEPRDLELLATAAFMLGHYDDYLGALERAHRGHIEGGARLAAARCAFWITILHGLNGEDAQAAGWLGRAERLIESEGDCVERGYLLSARSLQSELAGDVGASYEQAAGAAAAGQRFGDHDLFALAVRQQGGLAITQGRFAEGLRLLDEAMVSVTTGELSPIATGLVYCATIMSCQECFAPGRAAQWTAALTRWCEQQPDLVSFTGTCQLHRAEIVQLQGAWPEALEEARLAYERFAPSDSAAAAAASYQLAEIHRLRGEHAEAERAYSDAGRGGFEPQPGQALLRLAQGDVPAASAAIRRVVSETGERAQRARLLPAYVEIMLAAGEPSEAERGCEELAGIAGDYEGLMPVLARARGAIALARGDPQLALVELRRACRAWQELEAPYEAARDRVLIGRACRELGDMDAAALELDAAREAFVRLGAAADVAAVDSLDAAAGGSASRHGLTARELEVLGFVASGRTNKQIAAELTLSERTVDRHVSNILAKLRVPSRAAATAYAYEHDLI